MNRLRDLLGPRFEGAHYISTKDGARYVGLRSREAFVDWCRRHGVALRNPDGGRSLVARVADVDAALTRLCENAPDVRVTAPVAGTVQTRHAPTRRRWGGSSGAVSTQDLILAQQVLLQRLRAATPAPRPAEGESSAGQGHAGAFVKGGAS